MFNSTPNPLHDYPEIREGVRALVSQFDSRYWQDLDEKHAFPEAFVTALTQAGWLSGLIPEEYGGSNLTLAEASVVMEEINRAGGNSGACHGQMYVMGCVLRHGSQAQKNDLLPRIASGELRMQAMAVTEPTTGSDTTKLKTFATLKGDRYVQIENLPPVFHDHSRPCVGMHHQRLSSHLRRMHPKCPRCRRCCDHRPHVSQRNRSRRSR